LPYGLAELVHRLLARRPMDRYSTGAEVRTELTKIANRPVDATTSTTPPAGMPTRRPTAENPVVAGPPAEMVGGYRPVPRSGRPVGPPQRSADRTPTSTTRPRLQPNRTFEQRRGPSLILVSGLLASAIVLVGVLWVTLHDNSPQKGFAAPSSVVPVTTTTAAIAPSSKIVKVTSYDPEGTDGQENDGLVSLAIDGNPATMWSTLCYGSKNLGVKTGVGIVADLGKASTGTFTVFIASAPYQVQILTASDGTIPAKIADWGSPLKRSAGSDPEAITVSITKPSRYVLVLFKQLAKTPECATNPYRGDISEMSFVAA
jgi:hypothetical protein